MTDLEYIWLERRGRNAEGEKFSTEILVHGSGRILARVSLPLGDEYHHRVFFYVSVSKKALAKPDDCHDFIDLGSAKRFAEAILRGLPDPLNPPTARKRKKAPSKITSDAS